MSIINNLPHECLDLILYYLPGKINRQIISVICKKWNNAAKRIPEMILYIDPSLSPRRVLDVIGYEGDKLYVDREIHIFNVTNYLLRKTFPFSIQRQQQLDDDAQCASVIMQSIQYGYPINNFSRKHIGIAFDYMYRTMDNRLDYTIVEYNTTPDARDNLLHMFFREVNKLDIIFCVIPGEYADLKKYGCEKMEITKSDITGFKYLFYKTYYYDRDTMKTSPLILKMLPYMDALPSNWIDLINPQNTGDREILQWSMRFNVKECLYILDKIKGYGNERFLQEAMVYNLTKRYSKKTMTYLTSIFPLQDRMILLDLLITLLLKDRSLTDVREVIASHSHYFDANEIRDRVQRYGNTSKYIKVQNTLLELQRS